MENEYKEVYFHVHCKTCKHEKLEEKFDPCNECLEYGMNVESHKPILWEAKSNE